MLRKYVPACYHYYYMSPYHHRLKCEKKRSSRDVEFKKGNVEKMVAHSGVSFQLDCDQRIDEMKGFGNVLAYPSLPTPDCFRFTLLLLFYASFLLLYS